MKLNIGAGSSPLSGYESVDIKSGIDAKQLPHKTGSVEAINASHVLEHFAWDEVPLALAEWYRVLKPGGLLTVSVPDFEKIARGYLEGKREPFARYLMGGQVDQHDFHRSVFDRETLVDVLREAGFTEIEDWSSDLSDTSQHWISLNLRAKKPDVEVQPFSADRVAPKVFSVLSAPRIGFLDTWTCIAQALTTLKIPMIRVTGAFWSQCLTRGIEDAIKSGAKYILTLDYDSIFSPNDITALIDLLEKYPDADAVAPLQARRDMNCSLFVVHDHNGALKKTITYGELNVDLYPVSSAHFGLTLLRADQFERLARPWFQERPDPTGGWGEGRIDSDIAFWQNWRAAGNTLYISPRIVIGHVQSVVSWPDKMLSPIHQYVADYFKVGKPKEAWSCQSEQ